MSNTGVTTESDTERKNAEELVGFGRSVKRFRYSDRAGTRTGHAPWRLMLILSARDLVVPIAQQEPQSMKQVGHASST